MLSFKYRASSEFLYSTRLGMIVKTFVLLMALTLTSMLVFSASGYRVMKTVAIPGDGGWDYVSVDSTNRRVYVSHGTQIEVLDADSGAIVGKIPAPSIDSSGKPVQPQVHGAAMAPDLGRGFTTNGRAATMTIFDLKTLKILGEAQVADSPDGFLYDPATQDRKSTRLNSSHIQKSRMPSSA